MKKKNIFFFFFLFYFFLWVTGYGNSLNLFFLDPPDLLQVHPSTNQNEIYLNLRLKPD